MRTSFLFVAVAALTCAAAFAYWVSQRWRATDGARQAPVAAQLEVRDALAPDYSPSIALQGADARPGYVTWRLGPGEVITGVASARLCAAVEGVPSYADGEHVVAVQERDGSLRLGNWLDARQPRGMRFLFYAIWVDTPAGREWRTGWARIDLVELTVSGVAVLPERRNVATVRVQTRDGHPLVSALIAIDDANFESGSFQQYAFSDERGEVRVSGLEPDRWFRFSLPAGVGPATSPVETTAPGGRPPVTLVVPISGAWTTTSYRAVLPLPGSSLMFESVEANRGGVPVAWPATPFIGPGQGPFTPVHLMHLADVDLPERVTLRFGSFDPMVIDPRDADHVLVFRVSPAAPEAALSERSPAEWASGKVGPVSSER